MKNKKYAFCSCSEDETKEAGIKLAAAAVGLICIEGELGAGKTVLARGIAEGLKIEEYITSPTFNIINVYEKEGLVFNHMDAYRITDIEMLQDIGFKDMIESGDTTVIEWADMISSEINDFNVYVRMMHGSSLEKRIIIIEAADGIIDKYIRS